MTWERVCPICGKTYTTENATKKYCGTVCSEEAGRRMSRERKRREAEARQGQGWRQPRTCRICGEMFMPTSPKNRVCRKPECKQEDNRRRMHLRQDEKTRQREAVEALERGEGGLARNLDWRKGAVCAICGREFIPKSSTNRICDDPACKLAATRENAARGNRQRSQERQKRREEMLREAQACIVQPAKGAELPLIEAIRMPAKPEPKQKRRGPRPGSLEWCVAEADKRGMTYGKFVAEMEAGSIDG